MWQLDNHTSFAADATFIRDMNGSEIWVVAVKATYDIAPDGRTSISSEQVPVAFGPALDDHGVPLEEDDLGAPKANTDIILNGHAHSPDGKPVTELAVGFRVGNLVREAYVFGNRKWERGLIGLHPGKPEPFVRMPLHWGRCFGGTESHSKSLMLNPAGCGVDTNGPLPNVEDRNHLIASPFDRPVPNGFGPVPCHWPWRRRYAGTYDKKWSEKRDPLLPEDFDPRHWQIASPAQQYDGHLRGGEPIVFANLTEPGRSREKGRLEFTLPKLSLGFSTRFYDGSQVNDRRCAIHTIILEPDYPRVIVVHHMTVPCHPKVNLLDRTIITAKARPLDSKDDANS